MLSVINQLFEKAFDMDYPMFRQSLFDGKYQTNENEYVFLLAVPGLTKEDVNIKIKNNILNVSYKKEYEENQINFTYSNYEKSITLPDNVNQDKIEAKVENGILKIVLPKEPEKISEKIIKIN